MSETAKGPTKRELAGQETKENILKIATEEFSEKGLAGARIDEIAARTASSKRMIYYYFGGKDGLYRAVLERAYSRIRDQEQASKFETMMPEEAIRAIIGHNFDYHYRHPDFVRLVMNENIHQGENIRQIPDMVGRNQSVIDQLSVILEKGVASGVFREGIDPIELHMTISALSFYNVSNRYTFETNFGIDMHAPAVRAKRREQIIQCVMSWIKAD